MTAEAVAEAERVLAEAGVRARVRSSGHDGSIAVVSVAREAWPDLAGARGPELARRIRALGFRYVALDLAANTMKTEDR